MARDRQPELSTPDSAPADLLVLDEHTGFVVNGTLRTWEGGVAITNPLDIADLANMPGKRYRLIQD